MREAGLITGADGLEDKMLQMPEWPTYSAHITFSDYRLTSGGFGVLYRMIIFGSQCVPKHQSEDKTVAEKAADTSTCTYRKHTPRSCQSCGFESSGVSLTSVFRYCSLQWEDTLTTVGLTTGVRACGTCIVFRKRGTVDSPLASTFTQRALKPYERVLI